MNRRRQVQQFALVICTAIATAAAAVGHVALAAESPDGDVVVLAQLVAPRFDRCNAKAEQLLKLLDLQLPAPRAVLQTTGLGEGLDAAGAVALLIVGSDQPGSLEPRPCLRVAVADYGRFVKSLGGEPAEVVTSVRIAGQPLAVGRQRKTAVLMDLAARSVLKKLLSEADAARDSGLPVEWHDWLSEQDVALVVTREGIDQVRSALTAATAAATPQRNFFAGELIDADDGFDLDEDAGRPVSDAANETPPNPYSRLWNLAIHQIGQLMAKQPLAIAVTGHAAVAAAGVRITDDGDAVLQLRVGWRDDSPLRVMPPLASYAPPDAFLAEPFSLTGGGVVATPLMESLVDAELQALLRTFDRTRFPDDDIASLKSAVRRVVAQTSGVASLQRPADEQVGVYTNQFLLLRCRDANAVMSDIGTVIKSWNWLMDNAEGQVMQLGTKQVTIRDKRATVYEADMTPVFVAEAPEIREAMEALFGKGGQLRLVVVELEKHTVLLASGSVKQTESLIGQLTAKGNAAATGPPHVDHLLPEQRQFQMFLAPHNYSQWLHDLRHVEVGETFGGPRVRLFPDSPAVGAAVRFVDGGMLVDLVSSQQTVRALGQYLKEGR